MSDIDSFAGIENPLALAQAIVDAVAAPLIVLDSELRVVTASRSFYLSFGVDRQATQGRRLYDLGNGQWNIPDLRQLLEGLLPERGSLDGYEVEHEFPGLGARTMVLTARRVHYDTGGSPTILLSIEDITERRALEQRLEDLLAQKDTLLQELQHRVANSLAIIASILLLKARSVESEETRRHLTEAHDRVMSLASVQDHLHATGRGGSVDVGPYLEKLCDALRNSMVAKDSGVEISVSATAGAFSSSHAVSLGLIVTELVINALKHAFPSAKRDAQVVVYYQSAGGAWTLKVSDNGGGIGPKGVPGRRSRSGLGNSIVQALAN